MPVEWNTDLDKEFREYFPVLDPEPEAKPINWLWWGLVAVVGCIAGLADIIFWN